MATENFRFSLPQRKQSEQRSLRVMPFLCIVQIEGERGGTDNIGLVVLTLIVMWDFFPFVQSNNMVGKDTGVTGLIRAANQKSCFRNVSRGNHGGSTTLFV
jgi:hypothetical protein